MKIPTYHNENSWCVLQVYFNSHHNFWIDWREIDENMEDKEDKEDK